MTVLCSTKQIAMWGKVVYDNKFKIESTAGDEINQKRAIQNTNRNLFFFEQNNFLSRCKHMAAFDVAIPHGDLEIVLDFTLRANQPPFSHSPGM